MAVASVEGVAMPAADVLVSRESTTGAQDRPVDSRTSTTPAEAVVELVVDVVSDGRTTTSHSATVTRLLTSRLTGSCWRRLISTA